MSEQRDPQFIDGMNADMNPVAAEFAPVPIVFPTAPVEPVKRRWLSNVILTFTMFADINEAGVIGTLFALIRIDLGLGLSALGILTALAKLISAIFGPLWALQAQRFNRKLVLVVATTVGGVWTIVIGFSQNFTQFLILFVIATLFTVAALPIITEIVGDLFPDNMRGSATGMMWGLIALIGAITTPLFGQLANIPHGWRVGFYIIGGVLCVVGLVCNFGVGSTEVRTAVHLETEHQYLLTLELARSMDLPLTAIRLGCLLPVPTDAVERAAAVSATADVALVYVGFGGEWQSEGFDRPDMELPGKQNELIERVAEANSRTIVVLNTGSPIPMPWLNKVAAVVQAWYPGQECGNAIADILFGETNPSGKLPQTFPVRVKDTPAYLNFPGENGKVFYGEGLFIGYRYYDKKHIAPLFPFGFGLSLLHDLQL